MKWFAFLNQEKRKTSDDFELNELLGSCTVYKVKTKIYSSKTFEFFGGILHIQSKEKTE